VFEPPVLLWVLTKVGRARAIWVFVFTDSCLLLAQLVGKAGQMFSWQPETQGCCDCYVQCHWFKHTYTGTKATWAGSAAFVALSGYTATFTAAVEEYHKQVDSQSDSGNMASEGLG
jgi:hypothetical protein